MRSKCYAENSCYVGGMRVLQAKHKNVLVNVW